MSLCLGELGMKVGFVIVTNDNLFFFFFKF